MTSDAKTPDDYIAALPEDRKSAVTRLRAVIRKNLAAGFKETMGYGMIGYVVPLDLYPAGYHCNRELPLPFMNLASQKNAISLYHSGMYASPELLSWFTSEYPRYVKTKLDMGKSCVRFRNMDQIPYELIGELCTKMSVEEWIALYEKNVNPKGAAAQRE